MREDVANFIKDLSQGDFIVFAGAGIPKPTGIPDWKGLLKALDEEQPLGGVDIEEIDEYLYPEVAQMLFVTYEQKNKVDDYYRIIKEKTESKAASYVPLQRKIVKAGGRIITTNFDDTFEKAFEDELADLRRYKGGRHSYKVQRLPFLSEEKVKAGNCITYLHGKIGQGRKTIIFKTADYEKYYPSILGKRRSSSLEKFLRDVYEKDTLVFIGFSFSDRYLSKLLQKIHEEIKCKQVDNKAEPVSLINGKRHYALLQKIDFGNNDVLLANINDFDPNSKEFKRAKMLQDAIALEEKLNSINIAVVKYDYEKHKQMEDYFSNIANKRDFRRGIWVADSRNKAFRG